MRCKCNRRKDKLDELLEIHSEVREHKFFVDKVYIAPDGIYVDGRVFTETYRGSGIYQSKDGRTIDKAKEDREFAEKLYEKTGKRFWSDPVDPEWEKDHRHG